MESCAPAAPGARLSANKAQPAINTRFMIILPVIFCLPARMPELAGKEKRRELVVRGVSAR